jgi:hypothetical protein
MPPVILIKSAVRLIATIGVAKVLSDVVKTNTVVHTTLDKVLVNVGGFTLGSMVVEHTSNHVDRVLKSVQKQYEESKESGKLEVVVEKPQEGEAP